jgi:hypothetical protein
MMNLRKIALVSLLIFYPLTTVIAWAELSNSELEQKLDEIQEKLDDISNNNALSFDQDLPALSMPPVDEPSDAEVYAARERRQNQEALNESLKQKVLQQQQAHRDNVANILHSLDTAHANGVDANQYQWADNIAKATGHSREDVLAFYGKNGEKQAVKMTNAQKALKDSPALAEFLNEKGEVDKIKVAEWLPELSHNTEVMANLFRGGHDVNAEENWIRDTLQAKKEGLSPPIHPQPTSKPEGFLANVAALAGYYGCSTYNQVVEYSYAIGIEPLKNR